MSTANSTIFQEVLNKMTAHIIYLEKAFQFFFFFATKWLWKSHSNEQEAYSTSEHVTYWVDIAYICWSKFNNVSNGFETIVCFYF
jgi:hypothetical protein